MNKRILPTPDVLRQLLDYDPATGKLYWKPRPFDMFATPRSFGIWNTRFAGKEAFTAIKGSGYLHGKIFGRLHLAHRVIWAISTGAWPINQIDHRDGDRLNNAIENLRESNHSQNMHNQSNRVTNKSGYKGVSWDKKGNKFRAQISVNSKKIHLGCYETAEEAYLAYCVAADKYHGDFARTK